MAECSCLLYEPGLCTLDVCRCECHKPIENPRDAELSRLRAEVADLRADVELHKAHWTEAREERDKIRAWLCEKGYDAEYKSECDVPGCPKAWEAELADLRARLARVVAALNETNVWLDVWARDKVIPIDRKAAEILGRNRAVLAEKVRRDG